MEPGLFETGTFDGGARTFPNGCHVCEVEIDAATGALAIVRYTAVEDVGRMINPLLVAGQVHGGIAQGVGQALMESIVYDASGQLVTGSFQDYCMPRADNFCAFALAENEVPTKTNPLGVKGAGESGTVGALAAVMSAVNDALHRIGAPAVQMPATSETIWRAIAAARRNPALCSRMELKGVYARLRGLWRNAGTALPRAPGLRHRAALRAGPPAASGLQFQTIPLRLTPSRKSEYLRN